jgi:fructokinase
MPSEKLYGAIEAGGTKWMCAVGSGPGHILREMRIPTTSPDETIGRVIDFFRPSVEDKSIGSLGIACFGPVDLDPRSPTFGYITTTPKPGWRNTDVASRLGRELGVAVQFDLDVSGAALGEYTWGAGRGCDPALYLTVGTGIGGGIVINGASLKGLVHPEMGHILLPHDTARDPFPGACPFHGDCFEGLASGPAIQKRFGRPGTELDDDDPYWALEAHYIALAVESYILTLSPRKVILGGGIMQRRFLFDLIRPEVRQLLNGYVQSPIILDHTDELIVPPGLGTQSGGLGAIALAASADRAG